MPLLAYHDMLITATMDAYPVFAYYDWFTTIIIGLTAGQFLEVLPSSQGRHFISEMMQQKVAADIQLLHIP